jgi:hypothetical protein
MLLRAELFRDALNGMVEVDRLFGSPPPREKIEKLRPGM